MKPRKVISRKNLPTSFPISHTLLYVLAMDYWNAPQWLWGSLGAVMLIIWIASIIGVFTQEEIDIIEKPTEADQAPKEYKSKFQERLDEAMKQNEAIKQNKHVP